MSLPLKMRLVTTSQRNSTAKSLRRNSVKTRLRNGCIPLDYSTLLLPPLVGACLMPINRNEQVAVVPL